jgi:pyrroline-5-carboxylate reductase
VIAFIGGGNMAEALIKGITSRGGEDIVVSEPREERRRYFAEAFHIAATASNAEAAAAGTIVVLAVKPQIMAAVLDEIAPVITAEKTVVSIAAGVTLATLQAKLRTERLIRVMPNTPALVQEGMSVLSLCSCLPEKVIAPVRDIFMAIGKVLTLPEKHMNAVTAVSGSGPAFYARFAEAIIGAGEQLGLTREVSAELAVQTFIGTARLLETGMPPENLRKMVTSPGGTTAAGLNAFDAQGLDAVVAAALLAAKKRGEELGG